MKEMLKNFARSILALPYDAGIFKERPSDSLARWKWARTHRLRTLVAFYDEDCLLSELFLRSARALDADVRNHAAIVYLAAGQEGARELARELGVDSWPRLVLTGLDGTPLTTWGTTVDPVEVVTRVQSEARRAAAAPGAN